MPDAPTSTGVPSSELTRGLGFFDSTMIVAGSMIGSGIFIVSAEISRQLGSAGWLLASWAITGLLTIAGALSYGELASMMPRAGGQYVYLREAFSPLWGFLYGWTLFLVIQTGTIAAVAVGFARYLGTLAPQVSESSYLMAPIHIGSRYALSLSTAQVIAILLVLLLTWTNTRGLDYGRLVQNTFTTAKIGSLLALIVVGIGLGWNAHALSANFSAPWTPRGATQLAPGLAADTAIGVLVALCVAQVGSLFSADAWNNITFTAGEVRRPSRNVPLSLACGTILVISLYLLANVAYVVTLPLDAIQHAPSDRVASAMLQAIFPRLGGPLIAIAIMISTFGCINGMILSGARAYFAMAKDGVFFPRAATVNRAHVPGAALIMQGVWCACLILARTYDPQSGTYGNLYSNLLDYVIAAALIFYILTIAGIFRLRRLRPNVDRPYKAFGYPVVPLLYIASAAIILAVLFTYRPATTFPGVVIVVIGIPVYALFKALVGKQ
ncbi:MAG: amino acid permease [Acidobacteriaceae bacterium]|nr:amino acid permease [Acidobacteriaceae bacterium]MBV9779815.1 amino acid permease [Acidobacteriaceae bacterium]